MAKLGDICTIQSGGTPSRSNKDYWDNGTIPWVKISDFSGKYLSQTSEKITQAGLDGSSAKIFPKGTILYTIFATLGETCILDIDATTNQAIAGLKLNDESVSLDYLYYYLLSKKEYVNEIGRGVAQNNINMKILREMEIVIPSKEEQKRITDVLNKVYTLIDLRKEQIAKLDQLVKSRFIELFDGYAETTKLSEVAVVTGGLTKNSKRDQLPLRMPYLRVANVAFASIDVTEMLDIGLTRDEYEKTLLEYEDMLFVEGNGSPDQIGRVAIWRSEITPCVHQNHLIKARFNQGVVKPVFAMHYFMSQGGREQIKSKAVSTSGLFTLSVSKVADLLMPVPPMDLQADFVTFVEQTDKSKLVIQQSLDKLETLKKSLMQEYFG